MKAGDVVKFIDGKVRILHSVARSSLSTDYMFLRQDVVGIIIKKSKVKDKWVVNFPHMGGVSSYHERWLEVISEL